MESSNNGRKEKTIQYDTKWVIEQNNLPQKTFIQIFVVRLAFLFYSICGANSSITFKWNLQVHELRFR